MKWRVDYWLLIISFCFTSGDFSSLLFDCRSSTKELATGQKHVADPLKRSSTHSIDFYHHSALPAEPRFAFSDIYLQLSLTDDDDYLLYQGEDCASTVANIEEDNRWFGFFRSPMFFKSRQLDLFNDTIIALKTAKRYEISVTFRKVNMGRLVVFVSCILVFLLSPSIVRHSLFFYACGSSLGVLASVLFVVFIAYRFAPKRLIGAPIIVGGWSVSLYMLHYAWTHFASIMMLYKVYVISYLLGAVLISLAICYKRGPPTDVRSQDLMQWSLQLISLGVLYVSCQLPSISLSAIAILTTYQLFGHWISLVLGFIFYPLIYILKYLKYSFFPPRHEFLTMEEYHRQAEATTKIELEKLRQYCLSPDVDAWKIMRTVKSPNRLARFAEGTEGHVSSRELRVHEEYESERENAPDEDMDDYQIEDESDEENERREISRRENTRRDRRMEEEEEEEEGQDDSWDEIMIRRKSRDNRPASVERYRVPPNISSTLSQRIAHYSPREQSSSGGRNAYTSPRHRNAAPPSSSYHHRTSLANGKRQSRGTPNYLSPRRLNPNYSDSE